MTDHLAPGGDDADRKVLEPSVATASPRDESVLDDVDLRDPDTADDDDELPPFTEQLSQQLGGVRGIIESGIPIGVFVIVNVVWEDKLRMAIITAVAVAVAIAIMRGLRKEPIRHALNGLFGIVLGAFLAWKSGDQGDFYIPGIIQGGLYGIGLMISVAVKHPLVGWFWSVIAAGGKPDWRDQPRLVRVFSWLTLLWGAVFLLKNIGRWWLYTMDYDNLLGIVTLIGGYPVTALLVLITLWSVRMVKPKEQTVVSA